MQHKELINNNPNKTPSTKHPNFPLLRAVKYPSLHLTMIHLSKEKVKKN